MKKVFYFVLALGFALVGCNETTEPVYDYFEVLTQEDAFNLPRVVEGEAVLEIAVKADYPLFDVTVDGEWLKYVPAAKSEAEAVESVLKFTYGSNDVMEPRTATITVTAGEKELAKFTVTQAAKIVDEIKPVWVYTVAEGGKMEALHPAVDAQGNVYVTESTSTSLHKILSDGTLGWTVSMVPSAESAEPWKGQISVPSVEPDGSVVYAGGGTEGNGAFFAFNTADGSVKWEFSSDKFWAASNAIPNPKINRLNAAIGKECIYIGNGGTTGTALAINKTTGERVSYVSSKTDGTGGPTGGTNVGMSITKGGTVMFRGNYGAFAVSSALMDNPGEDGFVTYNSRYYDKTMKQNNANIACFTKDGKDHFAMFGTNDNNGMNIIWGPVDATSELAYYAADGKEPTWTTHAVAGAKKQDQGGLVIGAKGEIIVTLKTGPGSVYAVDPATNQMAWRYDTGVEMGGSPAVDAAGNVHVYDDYGKYYILKPDYENKTAQLVQSASLLDIYAEVTGKKWNEGDRCKAYGAPIIGKDGKMYLSIYFRDSAKQPILSAVFCLEAGICTSYGNTPWPLKNGDCFNSGNQLM